MGKNNGKTGRGNDTKLSPEIHQILVGLIRRGLTYTQACDAVGIACSTFWNWRKWGERDGAGIYYDFFEDIKKAKAEALAHSVQIVLKAAQGGDVITEKSTTTKTVKGQVVEQTTTTVEKEARPAWQAAAWFLERKDPQNWAKRQIHQVEVDWRSSLDQEGINPDKLMDQLVESVIPMLESSVYDPTDANKPDARADRIVPPSSAG